MANRDSVYLLVCFARPSPLSDPLSCFVMMANSLVDVCVNDIFS